MPSPRFPRGNLGRSSPFPRALLQERNPARVPGQRPATVSEQFGERGRCVFGADARSRRSWARLVWMPLKTPVGSSVAAGAPAPEFGGLKNLMATRLSKRLSRRRCLECATSPTGHLRVACVAAPAWLGHRAGCGVAAMIEGGGAADVPAQGDVHANVAR